MMVRLIKVLALAAGLILGAAAVAAEVERPSSADVTAAVIYNLLLFIDWPEADTGADGNFRLCLLEGGALESALRKHEGKKVHGAKLSLRQVAGTPDEMQQCRAAFVAAGNPGAIARLAIAAKSQSLLVIGEGAAAVGRGAMIGIGSDGGRIVFDIDLGALRRAGLVASSKLLRLARQVVE